MFKKNIKPVNFYRLFYMLYVGKITYKKMETDETYNSILDYLRNEGWHIDEVYTKSFTTSSGQQVLFNGVPIQQKPRVIKSQIDFNGFGDIDGEQILGYTITLDEQQLDTIYVYNYEEFVQLYKNIFKSLEN